MRTRVRTAAVAISTAAALTATLSAFAAIPDQIVVNPRVPFTFALWGDMPYYKPGTPDLDTPKIPALIADINRAKVKFSIFDGDIKSGSSRCDNAVYADAIDRFNQFETPMVYVPGDNEWTDCHRTNNGGYNNLERLDYLRRTMFSSASSFGKITLPLEHQGQLGAAYSENTRWTYGGIVFVGLNVPGSNNNKVNSDSECTNKSARTLQDCADDNAEYAARNAQNIAFMRSSFALARQNEALGVMIVIQADPSFDLPETENFNERTQPGFDGYDQFLAALVEETRAFAGQVVLVHGDTHFFKVDKPLINQANLIENFTRVETFGSPNIHWVKVTVDPQSRNVFNFEPMIVSGN